MALARQKPVLVSVHDSAEMLGCTLRTLQRYRRAGRIAFVRKGQHRYCIREEIELLCASDRTEWLAIQLLAPESDGLTANDWFARWADLQDRLARADGTYVESKPLLREVERSFGGRRMDSVTVGELRGAIAVLDASTRVTFIGLLALAGLPDSFGLLEARRRIAVAFSGRPFGLMNTRSPANRR
jgi:hypothetical protein